MNNDEMDDAEFEAFLKGEGELSSRLQALAQPSPSAELDAAILARATVDAARHARPAAANDAGEADAPTPQLGRLSWRWRVPAGIAATVLVGVVANQTWRANEAAQMEAMSAKAEPAAEVVMVQQVNAPVAEVSALEVSKPVAAAAPRAPAVVAESVASPPPPILEEKSLPLPPFRPRPPLTNVIPGTRRPMHRPCAQPNRSAPTPGSTRKRSKSRRNWPGRRRLPPPLKRRERWQIKRSV
jgi:hypothetical protein